MKLPRDLSGHELIKALGVLGYQPTRQTGSHVRLTTWQEGEHHITVPLHSHLKVGTAAADANDFIVYNNSTGALYYDADGSGATAAVQFATVYSAGTTPATLNAAEFMVI